MESTKRSRRDYFSGSPLSFSFKRPRQDYFSGPSPHSRACKGPDTELLLQPQAHRGRTQAGPQGGAISFPQSGCHSVSHHPQTPPRSAHPDLVIEVGPEPPAADLTSSIPPEDLQDAESSTYHIPSEDLPLVILSPRRNFLDTLNRTSALTCLAGGSDLPLEALRDRGHPHHPLLAVLESAHPPSGDGVSNGNTENGVPQDPSIKQNLPLPTLQ